MHEHQISRRALLTAGGAGLLAAGVTKARGADGAAAGIELKPFRFCLNTSTIRGQKLGIEKEVEVAAKAGYDAIEPWVGTVREFKDGGGSLPDLKKKIADLGLTVEGAIDFPSWIVDDDARRAKGLEQAKQSMEIMREIGGKRIAAPPAGANREPGLDLFKAAERYRALLEAGDDIGVTPALEIWGPSANMHRLGEAVLVCIEADHPKANLLPDVYHVYKGGSGFQGLKLLSNRMIQIFHMNDYPADPPREKASDRDRVMPGDGIAPLAQILGDLRANGGGQVLSLELFSQKYWAMDPLEVAKTGLAKMKAAVASAEA